MRAQHLEDLKDPVLRPFLALTAYIKREETSQISDLSFHFQRLE